MNESPTTVLPEPQHSFLDAEHAKADEAELMLKASLASFLDPEPASAPALVVELGESRKDGAQAYDFRNPMLLAPAEMRKLRLHQEEFIQALAARLSIHLRSEFSLKLTGIQTVAYQKFAVGWARPAHLTLFKMEPLRGVSILEISTLLGTCMVDRLMGGPGTALQSDQEISEIEKVLLEQTVQLILEEWCGHWSAIKELAPVILGYESNGSFIQSTSPEAVMLVIGLEAGFGECTGRMQLGVPYAAMEPLVRRICQNKETLKDLAAAISPAPTARPTAWKWNNCFNDVPVPVTAEWVGLELTTRQILALKVGDVLPMASQQAQQVNVRVAEKLKFKGRPGTLAGQWAVQLTQVINT